MKKQILTLIIGILIGAILTTGVFIVLGGNRKGPRDRMNRGDMPPMDGRFPEGENVISRPRRDMRDDYIKPEQETETNADDV